MVSHLHTQEVAQADLRDVVADILVIIKGGAGNVGIARVFSSIRLREVRFLMLPKVTI